jgi:hypothetical protein
MIQILLTFVIVYYDMMINHTRFINSKRLYIFYILYDIRS